MFLKNIVIGNCINSIVYAFTKDYYYLATNDNIPPFYKTLPIRILASNRQDYTWSRFILLMSLQGKVLSCADADSIKIDEDKITIVQNGHRSKYFFDNCYIFDTTDLVLQNKISKTKKDSYKVYDDFEISNLGSKHKYLPPMLSTNNFVSQIHYYISDRVDGANYVTDCLVESVLCKDELNSFDYSDSMVRFYVERHLHSIGVYGNFMNFYKNGSPKYRKPKVIHKTRQLQKVENNTYLDSEKIKFMKLSLGDIFT